MNNQTLSDRAQYLIQLCEETLASVVIKPMEYPHADVGLYNQFRSSSLSFIRLVYGTSHSYYEDFDKSVNSNSPSRIKGGKGILKAIKDEIDGGWLVSLKGLISADIFLNFLEMSEHLLSEGYKDPAAVMIGSVLEEHLRNLCINQNIDIIDINTSKPKKADTMNTDLVKASVYNKLDQKNVTAWLDLRNKAAHGKYGEYNKQQVEQMLGSVSEFIARISV